MTTICKNHVYVMNRDFLDLKDGDLVYCYDNALAEDCVGKLGYFWSTGECEGIRVYCLTQDQVEYIGEL